MEPPWLASSFLRPVPFVIFSAEGADVLPLGRQSKSKLSIQSFSSKQEYAYMEYYNPNFHYFHSLMETFIFLRPTAGIFRGWAE
jgi:hypothetical protein